MCAGDMGMLRRILYRAFNNGGSRDWNWFLRQMGIPVWRDRFWDADHIVPVVEGGGGCGLDNYRTLCIWCHRDETAALAKRRAQARQDAQRPLLTVGES